MKYLTYYITPVLSPIIIIGILLGGHWMWLVFGELLIAKFILEIVNYMEHYGLSRHSVHHEKTMTKFWKLDPYEDAPQMPYGYLTTLFICLIPPIWYSVISTRLSDWEAKYIIKA